MNLKELKEWYHNYSSILDKEEGSEYLEVLQHVLSSEDYENMIIYFLERAKEEFQKQNIKLSAEIAKHAILKALYPDLGK